MLQNKYKHRIYFFKESGSGTSTDQEVIQTLDKLQHDVRSSEATEKLFPPAQFDMLMDRIAELDENDPSWKDVSRRVLNLIALHDADSKTDSWDDFGLDKKEDVLNLLHLLREQIYGRIDSSTKEKSDSKYQPELNQTWPPQWVKTMFFKLNAFGPQARQTILKLLVNLGYVTTQKPANPLAQDQVQTQSSNYTGHSNVNKIILQDGTICYLTNNHVKFPQNGSLVESEPEFIRYDLKLLQLVDGSKKVGCKAEMLNLVKFNTVKDSQNYLQNNPELTLKTNQSLLNPADQNQVFNDKTGIEPGIKTSQIAAKYLFGTPYNFFYTIENGDQTVPGTSGAGIYDSKGELIALHNEADYYYGNLRLYKDILNPKLISLQDISRVASMPENDIVAKKKATELLVEKFRQNLFTSAGYNSDQARVYNIRLLKELIIIISKEQTATGQSQTYNLLAEGNLEKIINHGIDLSFQRDFLTAQKDTEKYNYLKNKQALIEQNRSKILEVVMQGKQIATAVPITRESLSVLGASDK